MTVGEVPNLKLVEGVLSGTSFSAPLVTFAAALLKSERLDAAQIKARLIKSVDVRNDLAETVYSRGILNFEKALAVYDDVVEYEHDGNTRTLFGHVLENATDPILNVCGEDMHLSRIQKVAVASDQVHLWTQSGVDTADLKRWPLCSPASLPTSSLNFETDKGERVEIPESGMSGHY